MINLKSLPMFLKSWIAPVDSLVDLPILVVIELCNIDQLMWMDGIR